MLFNSYFALFSHIFNGSEGFCLYHCGVYLCFSSCIQHQNVLHFAPFYLAFSTKMHCILHQNALRFAAYCTAFCSKLQYIQPQTAPNVVQMVSFFNIYSFRCIHRLPPFLHQNKLSRESIFCGKVSGWWIKMALLVLKYPLKSGQKRFKLTNSKTTYQLINSKTNKLKTDKLINLKQLTNS